MPITERTLFAELAHAGIFFVVFQEQLRKPDIHTSVDSFSVFLMFYSLLNPLVSQFHYLCCRSTICSFTKVILLKSIKKNLIALKINTITKEQALLFDIELPAVFYLIGLFIVQIL